MAHNLTNLKSPCPGPQIHRQPNANGREEITEITDTAFNSHFSYWDELIYRV